MCMYYKTTRYFADFSLYPWLFFNLSLTQSSLVFLWSPLKTKTTADKTEQKNNWLLLLVRLPVDNAAVIGGYVLRWSRRNKYVDIVFRFLVHGVLGVHQPNSRPCRRSGFHPTRSIIAEMPQLWRSTWQHWQVTAGRSRSLRTGCLLRSRRQWGS